MGVILIYAIWFDNWLLVFFLNQASCVTLSLYLNIIFYSSVLLCVYVVFFYALALAFLSAECAVHIIWAASELYDKLYFGKMDMGSLHVHLNVLPG